LQGIQTAATIYTGKSTANDAYVVITRTTNYRVLQMGTDTMHPIVVTSASDNVRACGSWTQPS
jgi:hypothetical protein